MQNNNEKNRRFVFLSHVLTKDTPAYGGKTTVKIESENRITEGKGSNTQRWEIQNHIGTHVDAPRHFFDEGNSVDEYPTEFWLCSNTTLVDVPLEKPVWIRPEDIEGKADYSAECLLIRTGWQRHRGDEVYFLDNPGLSADLARWLRKTFVNLKFVGMDFISVSMFQDRENGRLAHREFLDGFGKGRPVLPIEDMDLRRLPENARITSLVVAPLRVKGADGSPVTVLATFND